MDKRDQFNRNALRDTPSDQYLIDMSNRELAHEKATINIKKTVKLPSTALTYMLKGLDKQSKRKDFIVSMSSFGKIVDAYLTDPPMCVGCAATCTIQQIANKDFVGTDRSISNQARRALYLGFDPEELNDFEIAMNDVRLGMISKLLVFFGFDIMEDLEKVVHLAIKHNKPFEITENDWFFKRPAIEKFIAELKKLGY